MSDILKKRWKYANRFMMTKRATASSPGSLIRIICKRNGWTFKETSVANRPRPYERVAESYHMWINWADGRCYAQLKILGKPAGQTISRLKVKSRVKAEA